MGKDERENVNGVYLNMSRDEKRKEGRKKELKGIIMGVKQERKELKMKYGE